MNDPQPFPPSIDSIDLHVRTYRSALKSTLEVTVNSLTNSHLKMEPILHPLGHDPNRLDVSAFVYAIFRLPPEIDRVQKIIVGQTPEVFSQAGFNNVSSWPKVYASARRRSIHFNLTTKTLAVFAASISDIDDITNILIAYQTEWNKCHELLHRHYKKYLDLKKDFASENFISYLGISLEDFDSLKTALGHSARLRFKRIYKSKCNLRIQLLAGTWVDYTKTTQHWWKNITKSLPEAFDLSQRPIYFVSSNTHCLLNLFTGFALKNQNFILDGIKLDHPELYDVYRQILSKESFVSKEDFLYFASKYFLKTEKFQKEFGEYQSKLGVLTIPNAHYLDINAQVFPVSKLIDSKYLDPRLKISKPQKIAHSDALIFNIDYPLGFAAYHIFSETLENVDRIKGLYILGKAAVLNSEIGDIEIPRLVFDEHSQNSYMFKNCFNTFFPFPNIQGSILTNQKAVSVLGTYLENEALLKKYFENNLTIIEMESGPYLTAVTEATYDQQAPKNTIVDLNNAPFDIGIINYTSDTPYSKARNLGTQHLSLNGIESVYLGALSILQRIITLEEQI